MAHVPGGDEGGDDAAHDGDGQLDDGDGLDVDFLVLEDDLRVRQRDVLVPLDVDVAPLQVLRRFIIQYLYCKILHNIWSLLDALLFDARHGAAFQQVAILCYDSNMIWTVPIVFVCTKGRECVCQLRTLLRWCQGVLKRAESQRYPLTLIIP